MESHLSRESFLKLAQVAGLNIEDPHMDELFIYVRNLLPSLKGRTGLSDDAISSGRKEIDTYIKRVLPNLKSLDELNLEGVEPALCFSLEEDISHE